MDTATYAAESAIEADHWWYVGRRLLFSDIIKAFGLPESADILDVGTSAGTNLRMLRDLGFDRVIGVDQSREAIRFCAEKGFNSLLSGQKANKSNWLVICEVTPLAASWVSA